MAWVVAADGSLAPDGGDERSASPIEESLTACNADGYSCGSKSSRTFDVKVSNLWGLRWAENGKSKSAAAPPFAFVVGRLEAGRPGDSLHAELDCCDSHDVRCGGCTLSVLSARNEFVAAAPLDRW